MDVCLECFEIYRPGSVDGSNERNLTEWGEKRCPKMTCDGTVAELDELIAPVIITLNRKGYRTEFCCSGHWYLEDCNDTYIKFKNEIYVPKSIPQGFLLEPERNTIRYHHNQDIPIEKRLLEVCKTNQNLLKWAGSLNDNGEIF